MYIITSSRLQGSTTGHFVGLLQQAKTVETIAVAKGGRFLQWHNVLWRQLLAPDLAASTS
jgi:hypothetical protein